jgi:hypothetical protein
MMSRQKMQLATLVLVGILAFVLIVNQKPDPVIPKVPWYSKSNSAMAYLHMKEYVKSKLKTSATADFPLMTETGVIVSKGADNQYTVMGYVDAQHAVNAKIRTHYYGVIKQADENVWQLISLSLME